MAGRAQQLLGRGPEATKRLLAPCSGAVELCRIGVGFEREVSYDG
jgi:hypothetical protein